MRNFMNVNEVYPILDMINRKVNQAKAQHYHFDSPLLGGGQSDGIDTSAWQVESFEVTRDTENTIDPSVIKQITIIYRNGAIDTITLVRGLVPPVPDTVQDHEYINNLMIVQVIIETTWNEKYQKVTATIYKENGYGLFQRVELTYEGDVYEEEEESGEDYENPNDFYDGATEEGYDEEADDAEDYAGTDYSEGDQVTAPEDGIADGYYEPELPDIDVSDESI
jgi:hypothetical protein